LVITESPEGTWLTGETYTLADIYFTVTMGRILMCGLQHHFWEAGEMPAIAEYLRRVQKRRSYKRVVYDRLGLGLMMTMAKHKLYKTLPYFLAIGAVGAAAYYGYKHIR